MQESADALRFGRIRPQAGKRRRSRAEGLQLRQIDPAGAPGAGGHMRSAPKRRRLTSAAPEHRGGQEPRSVVPTRPAKHAARCRI
jgi:hypothetical protein